MVFTSLYSRPERDMCSKTGYVGNLDVDKIETRMTDVKDGNITKMIYVHCKDVILTFWVRSYHKNIRNCFVIELHNGN